MIFLQRNFLIVATLVALFAGGKSARGAQSYLIADSQTGYILEVQKPRDKRQVGSLTKIATAMVVLDWAAKRGGDLNQLTTITPEAFVGTGENHIGFQPGDVITLRDLLYAALVQSDNIASYALANHVGNALQSVIPTASSSQPSPVGLFVGQMNALSKRLLMERTRFLNPSGIDEKERPYSTAEDLARLTRYATSNAGFRFYVSQKTRQISFRRAGRTLNYLLRNTNDLLGTNGIDGVKTGVYGARGRLSNSFRHSRIGDCSGWGRDKNLPASSHHHRPWKHRSLRRRGAIARTRLATLRSMGCQWPSRRSEKASLIPWQ